MGSQKTKMGKRLKRIFVIIGNIFAVIVLTSFFIYAMEPEIVEKKLPMNPTEAIRDIGIYLVVVGGLLALANKIFNGKIKPGCDKLFVDLDKRIKFSNDRMQQFMLDISTKYTGLSKQYELLREIVNGQSTNIATLNKTIDENYKKIIDLFLDKK